MAMAKKDVLDHKKLLPTYAGRWRQNNLKLLFLKPK